MFNIKFIQSVIADDNWVTVAIHSIVSRWFSTWEWLLAKKDYWRM